MSTSILESFTAKPVEVEYTDSKNQTSVKNVQILKVTDKNVYTVLTGTSKFRTLNRNRLKVLGSN